MSTSLVLHRNTHDRPHEQAGSNFEVNPLLNGGIERDRRAKNYHFVAPSSRIASNVDQRNTIDL
jgi:hypothetical protein